MYGIGKQQTCTSAHCRTVHIVCRRAKSAVQQLYCENFLNVQCTWLQNKLYSFYIARMYSSGKEKNKLGSRNVQCTNSKANCPEAVLPDCTVYSEAIQAVQELYCPNVCTLYTSKQNVQQPLYYASDHRYWFNTDDNPTFVSQLRVDNDRNKHKCTNVQTYTRTYNYLWYSGRVIFSI
jgi:hypothetical protein